MVDQCPSASFTVSGKGCVVESATNAIKARKADASVLAIANTAPDTCLADFQNMGCQLALGPSTTVLRRAIDMGQLANTQAGMFFEYESSPMCLDATSNWKEDARVALSTFLRDTGVLILVFPTEGRTGVYTFVQSTLHGAVPGAAITDVFEFECNKGAMIAFTVSRARAGVAGVSRILIPAPGDTVQVQGDDGIAWIGTFKYMESITQWVIANEDELYTMDSDTVKTVICNI
jgi:hypothetical protein